MTERLKSVSEILRWLDREIWIVTAAHEGRRGGLTATWVSVASIDDERPAMLIGIAPNHFTDTLIAGSGSFALHLLDRGSSSLAYHFASNSGWDCDKLEGLESRTEVTGSPILRSCLAWIECRTFAHLETGDRHYYWADIVAADRNGQSPPIRESDFFRSLAPDQLDQLRDGRLADSAAQRPAQRAWRDVLPDWLAWKKT